ncbi:hypothetical protein [Paracoccus litorisediminis]|uniref:Uncharacterized protein n=1 Tax=Paracoccus litorisediminis TaxID=2006130 RepID=A0A844HRR6_9RHOB|nr:hypothetical protein [Paracoccus litorisediminis]MTH61124.1 hypothetical protein [Paracoccus litorisediminis]
MTIERIASEVGFYVFGTGLVLTIFIAVWSVPVFFFLLLREHRRQCKERLRYEPKATNPRLIAQAAKMLNRVVRK